MGLELYGTGLDIFNDVIAINVTFTDDAELRLGTGGTSSLLWETADANANALVLALPEGGATDVPVFVIGDASILNADLGAHNGVTEPTVAIWNDAKDAYVSLDAGDDAVSTSRGLYFKAAADEDIELLNLSITGTPRMFWDDSEDMFSFSKPIILGFGAIGHVFADCAEFNTGSKALYLSKNQSFSQKRGWGVVLNETVSETEFQIESLDDGDPPAIVKVALSISHQTGLVTLGGSMNIPSGSVLQVNATQVVGARVVDARCDDVINSGDATTDGVIDSLRDAMIAHGLIAAA